MPEDQNVGGLEQGVDEVDQALDVRVSRLGEGSAFSLEQPTLRRRYEVLR